MYKLLEQNPLILYNKISCREEIDIDFNISNNSSFY